MYLFRKLFGLFIMGFLFFAVLGLIGNARDGRNQSAYQQGFLDGNRAAAASGETAPEGSAPAAVPSEWSSGTQVHYHGRSFLFPPLGLMFCMVPLFFFGMLFMFAGRRRWHAHGHPRRNWGHGNWKHGPCDPGPRRHRREQDETTKEKSPEDIDDGPNEPIRSE